ncbi:hypothetical protein, partial [Psychrobacillus psychrotolerans]|uniref:hypothetical protein n=1 Tax=Psychrobacillus psychrotolerans TaxID=126156 RepID=UPI0039893F3A
HNDTADFRFRWTLSAGTASISSSLRKHMLLPLLVAKTLIKQSLTNVFLVGDKRHKITEKRGY